MRAGRWIRCGLAVAACAATIAIATPPANAIPGIPFKVLSCDPSGVEDSQLKVTNNTASAIAGQVNPQSQGGFEDSANPLTMVDLDPGQSVTFSAGPEVFTAVLRLETPAASQYRTVRDGWSGGCAKPPAGTLNVKGGQAEEGAAATNHVAQFKIFLAGQDAGKDLVVTYETVDNSADAPEDYKSKSGSATIPKGKRSVLVPVRVWGDDGGEMNENFLLRLTDLKHAPKPVNIQKAAWTIVDDDGGGCLKCH